MKKLCLFLIAFVLTIGMITVSIADAEWKCPSCGSIASGNFCFECGTKRPKTVDESAPEGMCVLKLSIGFEENLFMAKYDVDLFIDKDKIATMQHGKGYKGEVTVTLGKHEIRFVESDDSSVYGSYEITVEGDASFSCTIHSKTLSIKVDGVKITHETMARLSPEKDGNPAPEDDDQMMASELELNDTFNGPIKLDITVNFTENLMFSRYDVDLYLDNFFVTTLTHGTGYHGIFGVSKGIHVLSFQENGDQTVKGISQFNVDEDCSFSCTIECKSSKIKVSDGKIGNGSNAVSLSKDEYIAACKTIKYKEIERNPEKYIGYKTMISGKVIQVVEGWFDSVTLRVRDSNNDVWYITHTRDKGESRILENDRVTVYGECKGVKTYTTILGGSVTIPAIDAKYIDMR